MTVLTMDEQIRITLRTAMRREIRELERITRRCRAEGTPSEFLEEELVRAQEAYEYIAA